MRVWRSLAEYSEPPAEGRRNHNSDPRSFLHLLDHTAPFHAHPSSTRQMALYCQESDCPTGSDRSFRICPRQKWRFDRGNKDYWFFHGAAGMGFHGWHQFGLRKYLSRDYVKRRPCKICTPAQGRRLVSGTWYLHEQDVCHLHGHCVLKRFQKHMGNCVLEHVGPTWSYPERQLECRRSNSDFPRLLGAGPRCHGDQPCLQLPASWGRSYRAVPSILQVSKDWGLHVNHILMCFVIAFLEGRSSALCLLLQRFPGKCRSRHKRS